MTLFSMFEPTFVCATCAGDLPNARPGRTQARFCSYWCHLVESGPAFFTIETITHWLNTNRNRKRR